MSRLHPLGSNLPNAIVRQTRAHIREYWRNRGHHDFPATREYPHGLALLDAAVLVCRMP